MDGGARVVSALKNPAQLTPDFVKFSYENGAFLIMQDFSPGMEFGIDYKSFTVGPKFLGLKMIPPGIHFVFYAQPNQPRMGFWHNFLPKEVIVRRWDKKQEQISEAPTSNEQLERVRANLRNIDGSLAPYPYEEFKSWYSLTEFVDTTTIERLRPTNSLGIITSQTDMVTMETEVIRNQQLEPGEEGWTQRVDRDHRTRLRFVDAQGLPVMHAVDGSSIRFTPLPVPDVGDPHRGLIDNSRQLEEFLRACSPNSDSDSWRALLSELQYAFVVFLCGQVYEAFEQWKRLVHVLCSSRSALRTRVQLFDTLLRVLYFQLKQCPHDFFVDIVSRDNFLTTTLSMLFANIDEDAQDETLKQRALKFRAYLTKTFRWDFSLDQNTPDVDGPSSSSSP